ncbi:MAG: FAD-dependent oxidoreductase, partial [Coprobacillaceae bacterium]
HMVQKDNITLKLGCEATTDIIVNEHPDEVFIAVGGENNIPNIDGVHLPHVLNAWEVLNHEQICSGQVIVIGGGMVGSETAEFLAVRGCNVTIVDMIEEVAKEESTTIKPTLFESYTKYNVGILTKMQLQKITANHIECIDENNEPVTIPCDYVIMAAGTKSVDFDISSLKENNINVHVIGDVKKVADINSAIEQGYLVANNI